MLILQLPVIADGEKTKVKPKGRVAYNTCKAAKVGTSDVGKPQKFYHNERHYLRDCHKTGRSSPTSRLC